MVNNICLREQDLKAIADILGDTDSGLTKAEIKNLLQQVKIPLVDDGYRSNGYSYRVGQNKRTWLYNCFAEVCNQEKNCDKVLCFIEAALNPVRYTVENKRAFYDAIREETNRVLLLSGLQVNETGTIVLEKKASTLDEVDNRVNHLKAELNKRNIHQEVKKYCIKDFLRKDYFDAVFEASKGLAQRVRDITGLECDGAHLFQQAFSINDPLLFFNALQTESEKSEFTGLRELLQAIFHLVRNPVAHVPKVNWRVDEKKALDVLTLISFAHKYLDECLRMPNHGR